MHFGQRDEARKPMRITQLPSAFCHAVIEASFRKLKNSANARQYRLQRPSPFKNHPLAAEKSP
jgi:hypothetical protein